MYRIARAFHGRGTFVNAMVVQESISLAQGICRSKYFNALSRAWKSLDVAIVGVGGAPDKSHVSYWRDLLSEDDYQNLQQAGAVGDLCCRFFDEQGEAVCSELQNRTIGVSLGRIESIPKTIAVACGTSKAAAILAALRKKYINYLVTDKTTILKVLELDNDVNVASFIN